MKPLLVSVTAVMAACVLVLTSGSASPAHAAEGDCLNIEPSDADVAHFLTLPDTGPSFDFVEACNDLEACYLEGSAPRQTLAGMIADKYRCDRAFSADMWGACFLGFVDDDDPDDFGEYVRCGTAAGLYYNTMRDAGFAYFRYTPSPA